MTLLGGPRTGTHNVRQLGPFALAAMLLLIIVSPAPAEVVRIEAAKDAWISAYKGETDHSMGAMKKFKLKGYQEFALVDFDVSALKGRVVSQAYMYLKPAGGATLGLNAGSDLRWLSVSTVGHPWVEGKGTREYKNDTRGFGATFNESSFSKDDWGWPGAKLVEIVLGHANSYRFDGELKPSKSGDWLRIKLDDKLMAAMVAGATHGLFLIEGTTNTRSDQYIATRESSSGPYLLVTLAGRDDVAPAPVASLKAAAAPNFASADHGALMISLTPPKDAVAINVSINGKQVDRWQVPLPDGSGNEMSFAIVDQPAGADVKVTVTAVDAAGNASPAVSTRARTSKVMTVPRLPAYGFNPKGGAPMKLGRAVVWALPEITKVNPVTGELIVEVAPDIRRKNAVWDGATATVRLAAARAEIISFQVVVEGKVSNCRIEVSALEGPGEARISNNGVRLWRNWYVGKHAEYALPLKGAFSCPMPDNKIAGQKLQAVTIDYHIPKTTAPGDYEGTVNLTAEGNRTELKLKVKVYDVVIPDEIHFNPELNCYSGPGLAGSEQFIKSFQLAHYHRTTINRVPYSQSGVLKLDWMPQANSRGRINDWTDFDRRMGPLLDGSWFKDNPRAGVPVATLYLPFFEGWPLNYRSYYDPGDGVPTDTRQKLKHDILAKPIKESLDQEYVDTFVGGVRDFVKHANSKGWDSTIFEMYMNNKPARRLSLWTLDEPRQYLDWMALGYWAGLFKRGIEDPQVYTRKWQDELYRTSLAEMKRGRSTFMFRGDVSRPQWQGSLCDGLMTMVYANNGQFAYPRMMRDARTRMPAVLYSYGSTNNPVRSNWESAVWCLKAFAHNCDGILPWSAIGKNDSLTRHNVKGLIISTDDYGPAVASFRVHALRRGAQDCELLRLLQLKKGWTREHIGMLVSQKVPLTSTYKQEFEDAASAVTFGSITSQGFCEMKEGILKMLTE
ncbi:MAG: hypothetical protein J7M14_02515 [Planctomycetes bacterium]|nr:hypothetical protein [Planctomycetota bacterium]